MLHFVSKRFPPLALALLTLLLGIVRDARGQTPGPTPQGKPTLGQSIGNTVKDVVQTAFPAVNDIIRAIWPNGGNQSKNPQQATDALNRARQGQLDRQKPFLTEIRTLAAQLATIRLFFGSCVVAEQHVSEMRTFLDTHAAPTGKDFDSLDDTWTKANKPLELLSAKEIQAQIDAIPDDFARSTLQAIRDANLGQLEVIRKQITRKDAEALRKSLADLEPKLVSANALAGELIGSIGIALNDLPDRIAGALGDDEDEGYVHDHRIFVDYLKNLYPTTSK